ncbi:MAG: nitroreductase family deazaflavin-dependent oxidoreductase [Antricoccus sp.]
MSIEGEYEPSPSDWVRKQMDDILAAGDTSAASIKGMAVVVLTMRAKTPGKVRKVPLMRVEHEGSYAAFASLGGAPKNPQWYYNVTRDPEIDLMDGTENIPMRARQLEGDERRLWWDRGVAAYPPYEEYQTKTTREIPVFILEPR